MYHQIIHNVDASLTLHQMRNHIQDEDTVSNRRQMSALGDHCFVIGSSAIILSNEEKDATETNQESNVAFFHMYKARIAYYSTRYVKDRELKRENTICSFRCRDGSIKYSQSSLFVADPRPVALIILIKHVPH